LEDLPTAVIAAGSLKPEAIKNRRSGECRSGGLCSRCDVTESHPSPAIAEG